MSSSLFLYFYKISFFLPCRYICIYIYIVGVVVVAGILFPTFSPHCVLVFVYLRCPSDDLHGWREKRGSSAWVEWTCWPVPSWYLQIRLQGNGISCITRGPLKPSSLVWNALRPELFDQQTAAPQSAISAHYPRSRAPDSTWPRLGLLTQLIPGTTSRAPLPRRRAAGRASGRLLRVSSN